jgi:hypothetical protein
VYIVKRESLQKLYTIKSSSGYSLFLAMRCYYSTKWRILRFAINHLGGGKALVHQSQSQRQIILSLHRSKPNR